MTALKRAQRIAAMADEVSARVAYMANSRDIASASDERALSAALKALKAGERAIGSLLNWHAFVKGGAE